MRKLPLLSLLVGLFALPSFAAETYKDVSVVDVNCSKKVAADPDAHARACALKCAASGFGIVTPDKEFLKFDANGNAKITEALKASDKKDRLRVDVSGDLEGDTLESYINQTALISGSPRRCAPGNSLPGANLARDPPSPSPCR
jgi:hypothetical protein